MFVAKEQSVTRIHESDDITLTNEASLCNGLNNTAMQKLSN